MTTSFKAGPGIQSDTSRHGWQHPSRLDQGSTSRDSL